MSDGLLVNEVYTSVQGEGPLTGTLTQFVRFAGCNMRCPGWPCDTQHAIRPELYRNDGITRRWKIDELLDRLYAEANTTGAYNICLTGGEPLIQPNSLLSSLVRTWNEWMEGTGPPYAPSTTEIFTNGSFRLDNLDDWTELNHVMMDWKLIGSGEHGTALDNRGTNAVALRPTDGIKFVVKDRRDIEHAISVAHMLRQDLGVEAAFWMGRAWDAEIEDDYIVKVIQGMPPETGVWKLNVQLHKYVWAPDERGV